MKRKRAIRRGTDSPYQDHKMGREERENNLAAGNHGNESKDEDENHSRNVQHETDEEKFDLDKRQITQKNVQNEYKAQEA